MDSWTTALSISVAVLAAGVMGVLVVALATSGRFTRLTGATRRSFWCPYVGQQVVAEILEDTRTGQAVDVSWCTAFSPAVSMHCGKPCLQSPPSGVMYQRAPDLVRLRARG